MHLLSTTHHNNVTLIRQTSRSKHTYIQCSEFLDLVYNERFEWGDDHSDTW